MCRIPIAALPQREPRLFPVVSRQPCAHRFRGSLDWAIRNFGQHRRIARSAQDGLHPAPTTGPRDLVWSRALCMDWRCGPGISPHCFRWRRSVRTAHTACSGRNEARHSPMQKPHGCRQSAKARLPLVSDEKPRTGWASRYGYPQLPTDIDPAPCGRRTGKLVRLPSVAWPSGSVHAPPGLALCAVLRRLSDLCCGSVPSTPGLFLTGSFCTRGSSQAHRTARPPLLATWPCCRRSLGLLAPAMPPASRFARYSYACLVGPLCCGGMCRRPGCFRPAVCYTRGSSQAHKDNASVNGCHNPEPRSATGSCRTISLSVFSLPPKAS
jgi:hypothetical protein